MFTASVRPPSRLCSLAALSSLAALMIVIAALLGLPDAGFGQAATPYLTTWAQASPATSPPARAGATMAYDAANGTVVLFGGSTNADTWTWNGTNWTQQFPPASPPARDYATMAYAANGTIVLFGGYGASNVPLGDTWTWNGTNWTQQFPATSPPARYFATIAYDAATGSDVLFGGANSNSYLADTWMWNGITWTQQFPTTSPGARWRSTMAYDAANGTVVLFGGLYNGDMNDTWTWNGSTWIQQFPTTSPGIRSESTMAYDAATGTVVLFGGDGLSEDDTWAWNGATWTQQSPATSPGGRILSTTAYDAITGTILLFGGGNSLGALGDTWNYVYVPSPYSSAVTVGSSASAAIIFNVTAAGTLGAPIVLTQGAPNLDYTLNPTGTTCTGAVAIGTCTVNVTFTPTFPGQRLGAVELTNSSGTVIATELISATGSGPLATVTPGTVATAAGNGTQCSLSTAMCGDGNAAASAQLYSPDGVAVDGAGNLYIADVGDNRIRKVTAATGIISTVAGNGAQCSSSTAACGDLGAATSAQLNSPAGVAVDGAGNLYIADYSDNRIREVTAAGVISTVAGDGLNGYTISQDGLLATNARLSSPEGVAVDSAGNLYIADTFNNRIYKVSAATGIINTLAGNGYACSSGTAPCGDGSAAISAQLSYPTGVALDGAGNIYVADFADNRIRQIAAATGIITTVAGSGTQCSPTKAPCGDGSAATSAQMSYPTNVAVDGAGNLYIADYETNRIRKVAAATGIISTVAGTGAPCITNVTTGCEDGGAATTAQLYDPAGVAVDSGGNLYIGDQLNNRIRKISVKPAISFPTATAPGTADTTDGTEMAILNNNGNLPLTIVAMQNNSGSYVLANPLTGGCSTGVSVPAGGSCLLGEQFTPIASSSGEVIGSLAITDNSLNVSGAEQFVPLLGTTAAGAIAVSVEANSVSAGAASDTIDVIVGYSGTAGDLGLISLSVNGTAAGVGTPSCVYKGGHYNCSYPYTGPALATPGTYPVTASVAASGSYSAGINTTTLTVIGGPIYLPVARKPVIGLGPSVTRIP